MRLARAPATSGSRPPWGQVMPSVGDAAFMLELCLFFQPLAKQHCSLWSVSLFP